MLTTLGGADFTRGVGDLHPCSDDEAARLIAAGYAEPVAEEAPAKKPGIIERARAAVTREQRG
jgi:hypothetical protein